MSKKRVVIFGWANSVHIIRWVQGLQSRGFEVKVISLGGVEIENCQTKIFPRKSRWSYFTSAQAAAREALAFKPDLIHAHYVTGFALWALFTKFSPTVLSVWGADIIDFPKSFISRMWLKYVFKKSTHITATSKFLANAVLKLRPSAEKDLSVIPFGVELPDSCEQLSESGSIRLCFIKMHKLKYGPDVLLKAMVKVIKVIPDISLSMAGEGEMTPKLIKMVEELGIKKNVDFTGFIPNNEIYSFIMKHDIMVMPSVMDSESFGVAVIEASACGRPVIASKVGGVHEVLIDDKTGILVPPNDVEKLAEAIIKLAQNADMRNKMGKQGYDFVKKNYSWDCSLDQMVNLYERLIDGSKKTKKDSTV